MRLCDIGEAIQEVMESYEVELGGKTYQGMVIIMFHWSCFIGSIKDKPGPGITAYAIQDYTVFNGVWYFSPTLFIFTL